MFLIYVDREFMNRLTDKIIVLLSNFPVGIPSRHMWHGRACCDNGFFAGKGIFFYSFSERKSVQCVLRSLIATAR
jgi:hypothetical protein